MRRRGFSFAAAITVAVFATACGNATETTGPSPLPPPNSAIVYTALGASDVIGFGGSVFCTPWEDCAAGRGYVQVAGRELRARGHTVTVNPLGLPGAVLSSRIITLGRQYGRSDLLANVIDQEAPFVQPTTTLVTIFSGGNDVNVITSALAGGAGGADRTGFINGQVAAFGQEFNTLLQVVRQKAPSARIVVLNLPNMGGIPMLAKAPRDHKLAAQMLSVGITANVFNPLTASGVLVIDLMCDARAYQPSTYSSDGFHPNDLGYSWMAGEVVAATTTAYRPPSASCAHMSLVQ
jgi:lysophospholipase L1-like esterase